MAKRKKKTEDENTTSAAGDAPAPEPGHPVTVQVTFLPDSSEDLADKLSYLSAIGDTKVIDTTPTQTGPTHDAYGNPYGRPRQERPTHDAYGNKY